MLWADKQFVEYAGMVGEEQVISKQTSNHIQIEKSIKPYHHASS